MIVKKNLSTQDALKLRDLLTSKFLVNPIELSLKALRARNWTAVPVLEGLSRKRARLLASAARGMGATEAIAVCTEPQFDPEAFVVPFTENEILYFDADRLLRAFLLIPTDENFLLLHQGDYFYVLAGSPRFVGDALGQAIETAREVFTREAGEKGRYPKETSMWLLQMADRYHSLDGKRPR
jgi:hypothetical protein